MKVVGPRLTYWSCQAAGWGLWCILGLVMVRIQRGSVDRNSIIGYALFFFYSIGLTHLLGRLIERRAWLTLNPLATLARLAGAVLATAAIQTALVMLVSVALTGSTADLPTSRSLLFFWMNLTFGTGTWTALYIAITSWMRARRTREETAALESSLNRARLKALEAQMSPHFLFNCLNSLRGMIDENPRRAQDMVTRLANILRHNLARGADATTEPLGEQLAVVSDYLELESVRYDERLRPRFDIDPATRDCAVPAMLLQTLVENAVKHGIARLPDGGEIVIQSRRANDGLTVMVENTGTVAPPADATTRVGLANLRERLRLLFGAAATLELTAPEINRVRATVHLPAPPPARTVSGS